MFWFGFDLEGVFLSKKYIFGVTTCKTSVFDVEFIGMVKCYLV